MSILYQNTIAALLAVWSGTAVLLSLRPALSHYSGVTQRASDDQRLHSTIVFLLPNSAEYEINQTEVSTTLWHVFCFRQPRYARKRVKREQ